MKVWIVQSKGWWDSWPEIRGVYSTEDDANIARCHFEVDDHGNYELGENFEILEYEVQ